MTNKKNRLFTFIFSLLPGAGEMYMGFMKRGISIMALFFGIIAIGGFFNTGGILFLLPIIWFYSFFQVHNLSALPPEEFYAMEDQFLFDIHDQDIFALVKRFKKAIAVVLILIGVDLLWRNITSVLLSFIPTFYREYFYEITGTITRVLPQLVIGVGIILAGLYLIKGKKLQLDKQFKNHFQGNVYEQTSYQQEKEQTYEESSESPIYKGEVEPSVPEIMDKKEDLT